MRIAWVERPAGRRAHGGGGFEVPSESKPLSIPARRGAGQRDPHRTRSRFEPRVDRMRQPRCTQRWRSRPSANLAHAEQRRSERVTESVGGVARLFSGLRPPETQRGSGRFISIPKGTGEIVEGGRAQMRAPTRRSGAESCLRRRRRFSLKRAEAAARLNAQQPPQLSTRGLE